jgi:hypothetical protein
MRFASTRIDLDTPREKTCMSPRSKPGNPALGHFRSEVWLHAHSRRKRQQ